MINPSKTILIAGDQNPDYDIYLHSEKPNPPPGTPPTTIRVSVGGAGIIERVLSEVAQLSTGGGNPLNVRFVPNQDNEVSVITGELLDSVANLMSGGGEKRAGG